MPIILVCAAIGLFVVWTNPQYQTSKATAAEVAAYDDALTKSQELRAVREKLISKRNTFAADDVAKLGKVLPDNVDNIRLIIDINNIASRHNISLQGVSLGTISNSRSAPNSLASGASGDAVGSVVIGFSVTTSYNTMLAFLQDLEHSLRIIDVLSLAFSAPATANADTSYSISIRTYWLR